MIFARPSGTRLPIRPISRQSGVKDSACWVASTSCGGRPQNKSRCRARAFPFHLRNHVWISCSSLHERAPARIEYTLWAPAAATAQNRPKSVLQYSIPHANQLSRFFVPRAGWRAYVINRDHEQYCNFDLETQAQMIARSVGGRGPNPEYLFNTAAHLEKMGIHDPDMAWLVTRVRAALA